MTVHGLVFAGLSLAIFRAALRTPMRALVAVASRHGATQEVAEAIGRVLSDHGIDTDVAAFEQVDDVTGYDAFVLGSAVYVGQWLEAARDFVESRREELASKPIWLFSSGPLGDPPRPSEEQAVQVNEIRAATGAHEHKLFSGRLEKSQLSFGERAVVLGVRAPEGDFREWDAIEAWAATIAATLRGTDA